MGWGSGWVGCGMEWDGMGWVWDGMGWDGVGWVGMEWDGMGWDGMGWDGMGWGGVGWDGIYSICTCSSTCTRSPSAAVVRNAHVHLDGVAYAHSSASISPHTPNTHPNCIIQPPLIHARLTCFFIPGSRLIVRRGRSARTDRIAERLLSCGSRYGSQASTITRKSSLFHASRR